VQILLTRPGVWGRVEKGLGLFHCNSVLQRDVRWKD
jgi:hypothetical protein